VIPPELNLSHPAEPHTMRAALAVLLLATLGSHGLQHVERSARTLAKSSKMTWESVASQHDQVCANTSDRAFAGEVLAYVTPWNAHGYDTAKEFAGKLAWVSPVWFQLRNNAEGRPHVTGLHDVDQSWLSSVRAPCKLANVSIPSFGPQQWPAASPAPPVCPRIVPRVAWEIPSVSRGGFAAATAAITSLVSSHGFDGVVVEAGASPEFVKWLASVAKSLHALSPPRALIVVVHPSTVVSSPRALEELAAADVDRFSLMTYDYSSARGALGPNAPLSWLERTAQSMITTLAHGISSSPAFPESSLRRLQVTAADVAESEGDQIPELALKDAASRALVGIAFYGHIHASDGRSPEAITAPGYLSLLQQHHPALQVNRNAKEVFFRLPEGRVCYYPTLWSVAIRLKAIAKLGAGVSVWEIGQGLDYWFDLI
jgi:chitinase domain-containing protein 1